jgi:hypothetical protein
MFVFVMGHLDAHQLERANDATSGGATPAGSSKVPRRQKIIIVIIIVIAI